MYTIPQNGWFSDEVWSGGRNFGFFWLNKLVAAVSDNDFQALLIVIAVITEAAVAVSYTHLDVYKRQGSPWYFTVPAMFVAGVICPVIIIFIYRKLKFLHCGFCDLVLGVRR